MTKEQFNIRLPGNLAQLIRGDAIRFGKSMSDISEIIFADFFSSWTESDRHKFYSPAKNKKAGRPLSA